MAALKPHDNTGRLIAEPFAVWFLLAMLFSGCSLLSGCALFGDKQPEADPFSTAAETPKQAIARQAEQDRVLGDLVRYVVTITVEGLEGDDSTDLHKIMSENSQLVRLIDTPPDSDLGLERRYLDDEVTARKVLRSQGYYEGTARCEVDWKAQPVVAVTLKLFPGRRFSVGKSTVRYISPPNLPEDAQKRLQKAPENLIDFGVLDGAPAVADPIVAAVDKVPEWLGRNGFPFPSATPTYRLYTESLTLNPEVQARTGPFARYGEVELSGTDSVDVDYLRRLKPWKTGDVWSSRGINFYRDTLQQTGLFREVRVEPAKTVPEDGALPVLITATDAEFRKLSGSMRYSTDLGFGVQGIWEHKNLFSAGERLRLATTVAEELQEFSAAFTKPAFGRAGQSLVLQAMARNESTNAYDMKVMAVEGGLDRYFDWRWWGGARLTVQSGSMREKGRGWEDFHLLGMPFTLRYIGSNNPLNPTRGYRAQVTVTPYAGSYKDYFTLVRLLGELSVYHAPLERPAGRNWDRLVLAGRVSVGSMPGSMGANPERIPGALRFYSGGSGSVRGYKYQSIGPKDRFNEPTGGLSMVDVNMEARFRVTESIGIVPFVDGGMVYDTPIPRLDNKLAWAAGIGLRYYTAIGPLRMDVAFPLQDRGKDAFQLYLSLGQSF